MRFQVRPEQDHDFPVSKLITPGCLEGFPEITDALNLAGV
jgi:hypothetical protein